MANKIIIKEAFVSEDTLNYYDLVCPHCGDNRSMILSGFSIYPRREIYEEAQLASLEEVKEAKAFSVKQIQCLNCNTKSNIIDSKLFEMQKLNSLLNERIRELTGEPAYGPKYLQ